MSKTEETTSTYPTVKDPSSVGTYAALVASGGGLVWDDVLEYRIWCHPEKGAPDLENGQDYYYAFATYEMALRFSEEIEGTEAPLALVLQEEYINEPEPGKYIHIKEKRLTEWHIEWLAGSKRTDNTIPDFFAAIERRHE